MTLIQSKSGLFKVNIFDNGKIAEYLPQIYFKINYRHVSKVNINLTDSTLEIILMVNHQSHVELIFLRLRYL